MAVVAIAVGLIGVIVSIIVVVVRNVVSPEQFEIANGIIDKPIRETERETEREKREKNHLNYARILMERMNS